MNIDPERCVGCGNHRTVCICQAAPQIGWKDAPDAPGKWLHKYIEFIQGWYDLLHDGEQLVLISSGGQLVPFRPGGECHRYFGPIPKDSASSEVPA